MNNQLYDSLTSYDQGILWRMETKEYGKKPTKVPYSVQGYPASPNNPSSGTSYDKAIQALNKGGRNEILN